MKKYIIPAIILIFLIILTLIFLGCSSIYMPQVKNVMNSEILPLSPAEMKIMIDQRNEYMLVDVRSKEDYINGHIQGAISIPVSQLEARLDELPKNEKIIVYCQIGQRSKTAADILMKNGFSSIYNLGGIEDWITGGYPIVTGESESILDKKKIYEEISVDEAYSIFTSDKDYLFIDVRSESEYKSGHIKNAVHVPYTEIANRLDEIPSDKIIVVYCNGSSCGRSPTAADVLVNSGYALVYNMVGRGIDEWTEKGYPVIYEE